MRISTFKILFLFSILVSSAYGETASQITYIPAYSEKKYENDVQGLIQAANEHPQSTVDRVIEISGYFLGKPYFLGAAGEGPQGKFDQSPLFRTDNFDCVTYVDTVLAMAYAHNLADFEQTLKKINYQHGVVSFVTRNHFTSVDWNKNNEAQGYIRDITHKFVDTKGQPIARVTQVVINKPEWFRKLPTTSIKQLKPLSQKDELELIDAFRQQANQVQQELGVVEYLPLDVLFNSSGAANEALFSQIPNGAVIEIVRVNWKVADKVGTDLIVSHMGFAVRTQKGLMYREASQIENKIIDIPLEEYLRKYWGDTQTSVKGINVHAVP